MIRMPFGKHRGMTLAEIDGNYLHWLLTLENLSDTLRRAVQEELGEREGASRCQHHPTAADGEQLRRAAEAGARREAAAADMEVALEIVTAGAGDMLKVLADDPDAVQMIKATKAWLQDSAYRLLPTGAER